MRWGLFNSFLYWFIARIWNYPDDIYILSTVSVPPPLDMSLSIVLKESYIHQSKFWPNHDEKWSDWSKRYTCEFSTFWFKEEYIYSSITHSHTFSLDILLDLVSFPNGQQNWTFKICSPKNTVTKLVQLSYVLRSKTMCANNLAEFTTY